jgi:5-methylcytosine-specific restriction endonuclease McrA
MLIYKRYVLAEILYTIEDMNSILRQRSRRHLKPYAEKFYKSPAWLRCRKMYFNSKFGLCERCGETGDIVHHKKYITPNNINDAKITLSWTNLEVLCQDCHNKEHHSNKQSVIEEGLMFDCNGDLVPISPP